MKSRHLQISHLEWLQTHSLDCVRVKNAAQRRLWGSRKRMRTRAYVPRADTFLYERPCPKVSWRKYLGLKSSCVPQTASLTCIRWMQLRHALPRCAGPHVRQNMQLKRCIRLRVVASRSLDPQISSIVAGALGQRAALVGCLLQPVTATALHLPHAQGHASLRERLLRGVCLGAFTRLPHTGLGHAQVVLSAPTRSEQSPFSAHH